MLLYLPLSLILVSVVYRKLRPTSKVGRAFSWLAVVTIATLPLLDVLLIGQKATALCKEEGGLHVYDTTSTKGFLGSTDIKSWSKDGFSYTEMLTSDGAVRSTMENGTPSYLDIAISEIKSKHKLEHSSNIEAYKILRRTTKMSELESSKALGELKYFMIYPGVFDSFLLTVTPVTFSPWSCGKISKSNPSKKYSLVDVVLSTLKPKIVGK